MLASVHSVAGLPDADGKSVENFQQGAGREIPAFVRNEKMHQPPDELLDFLRIGLNVHVKQEPRYELRNKIIHEGRQAVTFDEANSAIAAAKAAIQVLNNSLPIPGDFIQLDPSVEHLQKTAGQLTF